MNAHRWTLPVALSLCALPIWAQGPTFSVQDRDLSRTVSVIAYGDTRFTDPGNTSVANPSARRMLVEKIAAERPDAVQMSGDLPFAGSNSADYAQYRAETASWRAARLRIYPALGNHELAGSSRTEDLGNWWKTFPELRGMCWYSVALGSRMYLLNLDSSSELTPGSPQRRWVERQLTTLPKAVEFVMITVHHPPVADVQTHFAIDHNPRPNEMSLRDYLSGVQRTMHARVVVVGGHIHNYERFERDGVVYLVSGGGGAKPVIVERSEDDLYQATDFPNFHYIRFTLEGKELKATMYRLADAAAQQAEWQARDTFVIRAK